jgi:GNAT superfamily N-acetyltransferase
LQASLFTAGDGAATEVTRAELREVQRFLEANPEYYLRVAGEPPAPDAAQEELEALPPSEWDFDRKSLVAFRDASGAIVGLAEMVANLFAAGVWHIGLFIIATRLHGSGAARLWYEALESWLGSRGCEWIRLGVAQGNTQAERFWEKLGYRELRKREGVQLGQRTNTIRVLMKPLTGRPVSDYLELVARDRQE